MQKIRLDIDNLAVESFATAAREERRDGSVYAQSTADCESDSGCPSALCTRDWYYPECRFRTVDQYSGCDFSCEFNC